MFSYQRNCGSISPVHLQEYRIAEGRTEGALCSDECRSLDCIRSWLRRAKEDQQMDLKMIEHEHHKDLGVPKRGVPQNYPKLDDCSIEHVDVGVQPV